jgi:metallo-beta-lactamase family protein
MVWGGQRIVFSGDIGRYGDPLMPDPARPVEADYIMVESTYGNRIHDKTDPENALRAVVERTIRRGGTLVVPAFAVGRAQELLYYFWRLKQAGALGDVPVFLDSPMAIEASRITMRHPELFDDEMSGFLREGNLETDLKTYKATQTVQESMEINQVKGPCLVMAGAGMCTGGRILHHMKHNLWRNGTHVLFVGYQAAGSLGRMLVQGAKNVTIHGEKIAVRAQVHTLGGFSAHAGQKDLLAWLDVMAPCRPKILINHGEDEAREALRTRIQERHGLTPELPDEGTVVHL